MTTRETDIGLQKILIEGAYRSQEWSDDDRRRFHDLCGFGPVTIEDLNEEQIARLYERMTASRMIRPRAAARAK